MHKITLKFEYHLKHRMPQYSSYDCQIPIKQEDENEIWLRIPINISSEIFSINFFIQSKAMKEKLSVHGDEVDTLYCLTIELFPISFTERKEWNVLAMTDFYPFYQTTQDTLQGFAPSEKTMNKREISLSISNELNNYLEKVSSQISSTNNAIQLCVGYLQQVVKTTSMELDYIKNDINQVLRFLWTCTSNLSTHSFSTYSFKKQLGNIDNGFRELIKRKQVSHPNYQYYLNETISSLNCLRNPDAWERNIPNPENIVALLNKH